MKPIHKLTPRKVERTPQVSQHEDIQLAIAAE